jgi:hypothetical protein
MNMIERIASEYLMLLAKRSTERFGDKILSDSETVSICADVNEKLKLFTDENRLEVFNYATSVLRARRLGFLSDASYLHDEHQLKFVGDNTYCPQLFSGELVIIKNDSTYTARVRLEKGVRERAQGADVGKVPSKKVHPFTGISTPVEDGDKDRNPDGSIIYDGCVLQRLSSDHNPSVKLVDIGINEKTGSSIQDWLVIKGEKQVKVNTVTDKNGNLSVSGEDINIQDGLTSQHAVAYILQKAHPKYYPKPGKSVKLDDGFIKRALGYKFSSAAILNNEVRKYMSFPVNEIQALQDRLCKRGFIGTTRVSDEFGKYKVGEIVDSDLGPLKVYEVIRYKNGTKHPYYDELTHEQVNLLSNYNDFEYITLRQVNSRMASHMSQPLSERYDYGTFQLIKDLDEEPEEDFEYELE